MPRLSLVLALAASVTACAGPSYTIEGANINTANERAARYCGGREATAQLEQIHQRGESSVQTYRCVASE
jgi:hypothetical protein